MYNSIEQEQICEEITSLPDTYRDETYDLSKYRSVWGLKEFSYIDSQVNEEKVSISLKCQHNLFLNSGFS